MAGAEQFFTPCPRGLEAALADELRALGIGDAAIVPGGVGFSGAWADCYRVNLHGRIPSRVLWRVAAAPYRTEEDLYRLAREQSWERLFDVAATLRVDVTATRSPLRSLEFATLRIKDAVCDQFRDACGERPSVDTRNPGARVFAYLDAERAILYLDTSGEPLFKRGWRQDSGAAPLRENLAAGILALSGWQPGTTLFDPMCGSGTFAVEAAQRALAIPPGSQRRFGFERLRNFDADLWDSLRASGTPPPGAEDALLRIHASDLSGDAVALTRANLLRAGLTEAQAHAIAPKQIDARHVRAPALQGVMVTNPPYGERIAVRGAPSPEAFFAEFASNLKQRFADWRCFILSSDLALQGKLRLAPARRHVLYNGAIECRLYEFQMRAGAAAGRAARSE